MISLHAYFALRNQQAFQRLLDASTRGQTSSSTALSSSGGKSWNRPSPLSSTVAPPCDVNARDWLGRSVLHIAVSSIDPAALEYVKLLLGHPRIDVNALDTESHWTPLHRALYAGNMAACLLLLQRQDIDMSLKDYEGYTAFDLYNSTVEGTKPDDCGQADLFTWGANRNATLGLGDGDDRSYPDQVVIRTQDERPEREGTTLDARFSPIRVKQVALAKLHTVVVTTENSGNIRMCGFGSGGRLGLGQHTQYSLLPVPQFQHTIVAVALGQDHTLALSKSGDVLSWGLNRFSQLGYIVEPASSGLSTRAMATSEEPIQATPRRIPGPLRKEFVRGIAACKTASACWTDEELFTWGTNSGQLGYDKGAQPVQVLPRKVTHVSQPIIGMAMTDSAMACLLQSQDVICFWNDRHFKINFPTQSFPSEMQAYRPPQAVNNASIAKVVSCDSTFAALSSNGEMFMFNLPAPPFGGDAGSSSKDKSVVKPQRVWALRKQFSAVKDVALGSDGSIILCTESGHVYTRNRNLKSGQGSGAKTFKFQRVPYVQRVVQVGANSTGAFAALRVDRTLRPVQIAGNSLAQDIAEIQPYMKFCRTSDVGLSPDSLPVPPPEEDDADGEVEDSGIQKDIKTVVHLCDLLMQDKARRKAENRGIFHGRQPLHGADLFVQAGADAEFPVHRMILASRCPLLKQVFTGREINGVLAVKLHAEQAEIPRLVFTGCHPITILIFLVYLYTDDLLSVWDRRIWISVEQCVTALKVGPTQIKTELQTLAGLLALPILSNALEPPVKRASVASMSIDMQAVFDASQTPNLSAALHRHPLGPDTILELSDKTVFCHSAVLRSRSPFFSSFFDDEDWTSKRWRPDRTVTVNLKHLKWRVMSFVLKYIYGGLGEEMFETIEFVQSADAVLDFMFEVMAVASELLLDRLSLVCSAVILKYVDISNVCSVLADATHFHALQLTESLQEYMACNLETLLESGMLDDLSADLIKQFSGFVRSQQAQKLQVTRSNKLLQEALDRHKEWLALQDIPQPILPSRRHPIHQSPKLSPDGPLKMNRRSSTVSYLPSPSPSPTMHPQPAPTNTSSIGEDIFTMDEPDNIPALNLDQSRQLSSGFELPSSVIPLTSSSSPWKSKTAQSVRVDMKTIMAEAESELNSKSSNQSASHSRVVGFSASESTPGTSARVSAKISPLERRKMMAMTTYDASEPLASQLGPMRTLSSPWRLPATQASPPASIAATPMPCTSVNSPRSTPPPRPSHTIKGDNLTPPSTSRGTNVPLLNSPQKGSLAQTTQMKPGMGPTFTPSKSTPVRAGPSMPRRVSDNTSSAWSGPLVPPTPKPELPTTPLSFVTIQQQQQDQGATSSKVKRSLREIQEEEQAKQAENEFMIWWAAEEERIKHESQAASVQSADEKVSKRNAGRRKKPPFKGSMRQASSKLESAPQGS